MLYATAARNYAEFNKKITCIDQSNSIDRRTISNARKTYGYAKSRGIRIFLVEWALTWPASWKNLRKCQTVYRKMFQMSIVPSLQFRVRQEKRTKQVSKRKCRESSRFQGYHLSYQPFIQLHQQHHHDITALNPPRQHSANLPHTGKPEAGPKMQILLFSLLVLPTPEQKRNVPVNRRQSVSTEKISDTIRMLNAASRGVYVHDEMNSTQLES